MRKEFSNRGPMLAPLPENCIQANFLQRIKRFSIKAEYNGAIIWAHCNNSGAMLGLLSGGSPVLLSKSANPGRKLRYTLERVWIGQHVGMNQNPNAGIWVGVNTSLPNKILKSAFYAGMLNFASGYSNFNSEVKRGQSRLDACIEGAGLPRLWVECKNVTLVEDDCAAFPDAVSARAQKHLVELMNIVKDGERAAMFYFVQRADCQCFAPADYIDMDYARLFYKAIANGVEIYAYVAEMSSTGTGLGKSLPLANHL